jgi:hypothetical protein
MARSTAPAQSRTLVADRFLCAICLSEPEEGALAGVSGCEHQFCFDCIDAWAKRRPTCPLCVARFTEIIRVRPIPGATNSVLVSEREGASVPPVLVRVYDGERLTRMFLGFPSPTATAAFRGPAFSSALSAWIGGASSDRTPVGGEDVAGAAARQHEPGPVSIRASYPSSPSDGTPVRSLTVVFTFLTTLDDLDGGTGDHRDG